MSTNDSVTAPPGPQEIADNFPISPDEAQIITDALAPVQSLTGVGSSFGSAMESVPGRGPPLLGSALKTIALQVNLAAESTQTFARAIDFYLTAQSGTADDLFPPPEQIADQLERQGQPLMDLFEQGPP